MARMSIGWARAWAGLDLPLRGALTRIGMADPVIIARSCDVEVDSGGMIDDSVVRSALEVFLLQIDLEEDGTQRAAERVDALEALLYASQLPATAHQARAACPSDFELTLDLAELERHAREKARTVCWPRLRWRQWPPSPRIGGGRPAGGAWSF